MKNPSLFCLIVLAPAPWAIRLEDVSVSAQRRAPRHTCGRLAPPAAVYQKSNAWRPQRCGLHALWRHARSPSGGVGVGGAARGTCCARHAAATASRRRHRRAAGRHLAHAQHRHIGAHRQWRVTDRVASLVLVYYKRTTGPAHLPPPLLLQAFRSCGPLRRPLGGGAETPLPQCIGHSLGVYWNSWVLLGRAVWRPFVYVMQCATGAVRTNSSWNPGTQCPPQVRQR